MYEYEMMQYRLRGIVHGLKRESDAIEFTIRPMALHKDPQDSGLMVLSGHCLRREKDGMRRISTSVKTKTDTTFFWEDVDDERIYEGCAIEVQISDEDYKNAENGRMRIQGLIVE